MSYMVIILTINFNNNSQGNILLSNKALHIAHHEKEQREK